MALRPCTFLGLHALFYHLVSIPPAGTTRIVFTRLEIHDWRQFGHVDIHFHPQLTILTGANASGKTTLLNILSRHFGWEIPLVRTKSRWRRRWLAGYLKRFWESPSDLPSEDDPELAPARPVGSISYEDGRRAELRDPGEGQPTYKLELVGRPAVKGLHIPSHRPLAIYAEIPNVPIRPITKAEAFTNYVQAMQQRHISGRGGQSATFHIKQTLVSLAALGYGNDRMPRQPELVETLEGFEAVLRRTLPATLGFRDFQFDLPDVFLTTDTGPVSLDAISGGLASVLNISWQIYMYSPLNEPYVVTIDEPENHLHPAMQRTLLADLLSAFPLVQFVVATHSPFIISSAAQSRVFVLDFDRDVPLPQVFSQELENADRSGTANEILRDVLGLPSSMPVWAEQTLDEIVQRYSREPLTPDRLAALRAELRERGLDNVITDALREVLIVTSRGEAG